MARKNEQKSDHVTKSEMIEARRQEMESILPGYMTVFMGETIESKKIKVEGVK